MFSFTFMLAVFGTGFYYFLDYRDWLDWNKGYIYKVEPGPCKYAIEDGGSEDLTHIGNGIVLISSGFEFGGKGGKVKSLNLNTSEVITMKIRNKPERPDFLSGIHGITTWREPSGQLFVYALSHPEKEDRIEVMEMIRPTELTYVRTITDPMFTFMNDLVAVGKDKFYITKFWQSREPFREYIEMMLRMKTGGVLYYDGRKAREVVTGLQMPNGINISPDGKTVYVAEFSSKKLLGFSRDSTNNLRQAWEVYTDTMVDNIEVDQDTGDLYIGCHPLTYKITDSVHNFFGFVYPSQVLRFKMRDNMVSEIEEMYANDGSELIGSTAATYVYGKLIIGTVRHQLMVCDVKYHSD